MAFKKVAVIGAGVSGLTAMKACKEKGMDVTCFEMHDDIGGIWYYTEHPRQDEGAVIYDFLIANTSREMTRFSDFHFPKGTPPFPQHQQMHKYLHSYAEHFDLKPRIQLNTKVVELKKAADYDGTGRWVIKTQKVGESLSITHTFDAVMYCIGFHRKPFIPEIEGFKEFKGTWSHSNTFKTGKDYEGKHVLVIGNANSACDAAVGISEYASQVYLSIGRGSWIYPRYTDNIPTDTALVRRIYANNPSLLSAKMRQAGDNYYNNVEFGFRPELGPLHFFPTINDDIGSRIASGKIKVYPRSVKFFEDGALLEDGTKIRGIDHILFATGFHPDTSLIGEDIFLNAYKKVFPVDLNKNTLAMVGITSTITAMPPLAEMQARFASLVFAGKHKLPSRAAMVEDVKKWKDIQKDLYGEDKHWIPTLPMIDEIASEIGVYPRFITSFYRSPSVALQTKFGPAFVAQYRLQGDGATDSALEDCKRAWELTSEGVKLRQVPPLKNDNQLFGLHRLLYLLLAVTFVIFAVFMAS